MTDTKRSTFKLDSGDVLVVDHWGDLPDDIGRELEALSNKICATIIDRRLNVARAQIAPWGNIRSSAGLEGTLRIWWYGTEHHFLLHPGEEEREQDPSVNALLDPYEGKKIRVTVEEL